MNAPISAIVDTNVILDIYSVTDLTRAHEAGGDDDTPDRFLRRVRMRESLLLGWFLHASKASTISLPNETIRIAGRVAPPDAVGTIEHQHMQLSIYFQKDLVLTDWNSLVENVDAGVVGNRCDDLLLDLAERHRAPLITNEGYTLEGPSNAQGLRARAIERGVQVFAPRQFWAGRVGEGATRKFLGRFDRASSKFLRRQNNSGAAHRAIELRRGILCHVFYGQTNDGRVLPVRPPWITRAI